MDYIGYILQVIGYILQYGAYLASIIWFILNVIDRQKKKSQTPGNGEKL